MGYEGVKFKSYFTSEKFFLDKRIQELRYWSKVFNEKQLAPSYPGGTHGNMSFRLNPGKPEFIITAARSSFTEYLGHDSFFLIEEVDLKKLTVKTRGNKSREPSSETLLHYAIYQKRPDIQAILHGHCKQITENIDRLAIPSTKIEAESGTMKIVESVMKELGNYSFLEIRNHGFLSMMESISEAGELAIKMLEESRRSES